MKSFDETLIILMTPFYHTRQRVSKPFFELSMRLEYMRHKKVHERPQLHQTVLERCARQKQSSLTLEVKQSLPSLRFEVFDVLSL